MDYFIAEIIRDIEAESTLFLITEKADSVSDNLRNPAPDIDDIYCALNSNV